MWTTKKTVFILFITAVLFTAISSETTAQVPDEIIKSLKTGNAKTLSEYFNQNIELVVLEEDNVCSKAQAQQIVGKFFSNNTPEGFNIIHQGGKEGAQYVVGNLVTNKGSFRTYFLLKKTDGKEYIHQLRIEQQ